MATDNMTDHEAIQMMELCKQEIETLQAEIRHLAPKADAYDNITIVLGLLPKSGIGARENVVWRREKRIRELKDAQVKVTL